MAHHGAHSSARLEGEWGIKIVEIAGSMFIELGSNRKSTSLANHLKKYVDLCVHGDGSIARTRIIFCVPMSS
jgi:hypothetical protein